jgi:hypothetical protein
MKFSEQVVLGSTLVKFNSLTFLQHGCGCLIGMAGAASGEIMFDSPEGHERMRTMFPWLFGVRITQCPACNTRHINYATAISCVAHHVEDKSWTFDQALAYIRSIEPGEDVDPPDVVVPVWNRYHGVPA